VDGSAVHAVIGSRRATANANGTRGSACVFDGAPGTYHRVDGANVADE